MENSFQHLFAGRKFHPRESSLDKQSEFMGSEAELKVKCLSDRFSETLHILANEPSLAFYRIEEHVRKSLPILVHERHGFESNQKRIQNRHFALEDNMAAVEALNDSKQNFSAIVDHLTNSIYFKQQMENEKARKKAAAALKAKEKQSSVENQMASSVSSAARSSIAKVETLIRNKTVDQSNLSAPSPTPSQDAKSDLEESGTESK